MQGSYFGPLFWNLYQNDLTYLVESNICMYADLEALMDCDDCKNCLVWPWYVEHSRYGYCKWTYKVIVKLRNFKF